MKEHHSITILLVLLLVLTQPNSPTQADPPTNPLILSFQTITLNNQEYLTTIVETVDPISSLIDTIKVQLKGINDEVICSYNNITMTRTDRNSMSWTKQVPVQKHWPQKMALANLIIFFEGGFQYSFPEQELPLLSEEEISVDSGWDNSVEDQLHPEILDFWTNTTTISHNQTIKARAKIVDDNMVIGAYQSSNDCPNPEVRLENSEDQDSKTFALSYNSTSELFEAILEFGKYDASLYNITTITATDLSGNKVVKPILGNYASDHIMVSETSPDFKPPELLKIQTNRSEFRTGDSLEIAVKLAEEGSQIDKVWGSLGNYVSELYHYRIPVAFTYNSSGDLWFTTIQMTTRYWPQALTLDRLFANDTAGNLVQYDKIQGIPDNIILIHTDYLLDSSAPLLTNVEYRTKTTLEGIFEVNIAMQDPEIGLQGSFAILEISGKTGNGFHQAGKFFASPSANGEINMEIPVVSLVFNHWDSVLLIPSITLFDRLGNGFEYLLDQHFIHDPAKVEYPQDWNIPQVGGVQPTQFPQSYQEESVQPLFQLPHHSYWMASVLMGFVYVSKKRKSQ